LRGGSALLSTLFGAALSSDRSGLLGLAVSGGGDSMAMLHLAHRHAAETGLGLRAVTVNHNLRTEAGEEAAFVAEVCEGLGVPHDTLVWQEGWDGSGNLQAEARRARYGLMAHWAEAQGIGTVALAHTADDQAETFLMRLAREAGVDGLSGMSGRRRAYGITWLRPLLMVRRGDLRAFLEEGGHEWRDDPSNEDERFERVRVRKAMEALEPLGIDVAALSKVTVHLRQVRQALNAQTLAVAKALCRAENGDVVIDRKALNAQPPEIRRRLLSHALKWVASADYAPRSAKLTQLEYALWQGEKTTLHGCLLASDAANIRITREFGAVRSAVSSPGDLWDGRWRVEGPEVKGVRLRATGEEGLRQCPGWRDTGRPRSSLIAAPSVWNGPALLAAPLAGCGNGWRAELAQGDESFFQRIISD